MDKGYIGLMRKKKDERMARLNVLVVYNVPLTEHARDNNIFLPTTRIYMFNIICDDVTSLPPPHPPYYIPSQTDRTGQPIYHMNYRGHSIPISTKSISVDRIERCPHVSGQVHVAGEEILGPEIIWQAARKRHVK